MIGPIAIAVLVALSILLMLLRPRGIAEVYWAGGGAVLLLVLRLIPLRLAAAAVTEGTDVYLFLIGMMTLSELARAQGVFDWLSSFALRHAGRSSARLFTLVYIIGAAVTVSMSNDATAVVLTPAVLAVARKARVQPLACLFACAMVANAASFVLPISNPANLVVFGGAMPPLAAWLAAFTLPSVLSIATTYAVLRLLFRNDLRGRIGAAAEPHPLTGEGRLVLVGVTLTVAALLTASAFHRDLGLPACIVALATGVAISLRTRTSPLPLVRAVSWSTLILVAALFILVDAAETVGALRWTQAALHWAETLAPAGAALLVGLATGIANNLVNNLPLGLLAGATLTAAHTHGLLPRAVLIGVDLGPNLSVTGSLATILWLLALRKDGVAVTFWQFFKVGVIAMPVALLAALAGAIATRSSTGGF